MYLILTCEVLVNSEKIASLSIDPAPFWKIQRLSQEIGSGAWLEEWLQGEKVAWRCPTLKQRCSYNIPKYRAGTSKGLDIMVGVQRNVGKLEILRPLSGAESNSVFHCTSEVGLF